MKLHSHSDSFSHTAEPPNLDNVVEEAELGEEELYRLQEEVDELQEKFDEAVFKKYSLAQICQQLSEKLKSANHLLERYATEFFFLKEL